MHESCQSNELLKSEESPWIYGMQLRHVNRMGRIHVAIWTLRRPVVARLTWSLDVEHQPAEVSASSNAGMNRVLEEVCWDQSSVSRGEKLLIPVEVRRSEIAEFDRTGRKVSIVDPSYS
jgi:hypothetical protein